MKFICTDKNNDISEVSYTRMAKKKKKGMNFIPACSVPLQQRNELGYVIFQKKLIRAFRADRQQGGEGYWKVDENTKIQRDRVVFQRQSRADVIFVVPLSIKVQIYFPGMSAECFVKAVFDVSSTISHCRAQRGPGVGRRPTMAEGNFPVIYLTTKVRKGGKIHSLKSSGRYTETSFCQQEKRLACSADDNASPAE